MVTEGTLVEEVWCEANILKATKSGQTVRKVRPMKDAGDGEIDVVVSMEQVAVAGRVEDTAQETVPRDGPDPTDVLEWARESQQRVRWSRREGGNCNTTAVPVSWSSPPLNSMSGQDQRETEMMPVDRAIGKVGDLEHQQEERTVDTEHGGSK
jgi:hypothetical protein